MLREPMEAPPSRPPLYSLLAAIPPAPDDPDLRWQGGVRYLPESCGLGGIDSIACEGNVGAMDPSTGPDIVEADPLWVWEADECSTFGYQARDWNGRATRALAATRSFRLARELWRGTVAQADSLENRWLAMPAAESDTVTDGPTDPVPALACVEAALSLALTGSQGLVHVTPQLLVHLVEKAVVSRTAPGAAWTTPLGNIVVADAGYTGEGPGGIPAGAGSQWFYGTPMIRARLGPVVVIPGSLADARRLGEALDRGVNTALVYAGQVALLEWHNVCAHIAAEVDVPLCGVGGGS